MSVFQFFPNDKFRKFIIWHSEEVEIEFVAANSGTFFALNVLHIHVYIVPSRPVLVFKVAM